MEEDDPVADPFGLRNELEEIETDRWADLLQPDTEIQPEPKKPEPRDLTLKSLRARLGWVTDEVRRRQKKEKATPRQRANLKRLMRAHKRQLGEGAVKMRSLKSLRDQGEEPPEKEGRKEEEREGAE